MAYQCSYKHNEHRFGGGHKTGLSRADYEFQRRESIAIWARRLWLAAEEVINQLSCRCLISVGIKRC